VKSVRPTAQVVDQLAREYQAAQDRLAATLGRPMAKAAE
jgi:nitronate monooxygenase